MQVKETYYVKRATSYVWLAQDVEPLQTDEVIEVRPMLIADIYKTLFKDGEEVGQCVWLRDGDLKDNYEEQDIPPEPQETEEPETEEENEDGTA